MTRSGFCTGALAMAALLLVPAIGSAQLTGNDNGEWRYLGGDAGHTRSSSLNQITAENFSKLKVAWVFRGDNFGQGMEFTARSTPIFVDGVLYTVMGQRRQGVAIDAATGDLLVQTSEDLRGEAEVNEKGNPLLHARDKRIGRILASVELPMPGQYGMMTFMHEGKQYIVVQSGSARRNQPGSLVALRLP